MGFSKKFNNKFCMEDKKYSFIYFTYINKIIGKILKRGRKDWALKSFGNLNRELKKLMCLNPKIILFIGLMNSLMQICVIKKRLGGSMKDLPAYVGEKKQVVNVVKFLIRDSKEKHLRLLSFNKLLNNVKLMSEYKGNLISENYKIYKKALDNRVFLKTFGKSKFKG